MAVYQIQGPDGSVYEVEGPPETAVSEPKPQGRIARALSYLTKRGREFVGAAQGVQQDVNNLVSGRPYGEGFPEGRTGWQTAADVAQALGPPVVAATAPVSGPAIMGAGLAAGATARGLGAEQSTAEDIESGVNLLGGLGTTLGGFASGARGAKAALSARYQKIADAAANRTMDPAKAMQLGQDLMEGVESAFTKPQEMKAVRPLLEKITNPQAGPVTFADLDQAKITVQGMRGGRYIRGLITRAQENLLEGTPEYAALKATNTKWARVIAKPLLRGLTGSHVRAASMIGAGYEAGQGNYGKAAGLAAASIAGGLSPGQLMAGAGRAAGPAARAATLIAGSPTVRQMGQGASSMPPPENPVDEPVGPPPSPGSSETASVAPGAPQAPSGAPFAREIDAVAKVVGLDPKFLQAIIAQESSGNPNAVSNGGAAGTPAYGLMQIIPSTFKTVAPEVSKLTGRTASLNDPLDNIVAGALLYKKYLDATNGNVAAAARMYHGGESGSGHGPITQQYGLDIAKRYAAMVR